MRSDIVTTAQLWTEGVVSIGMRGVVISYSLVSRMNELETVRPRETLMLLSPNCRFQPTVGMVTFIITSLLVVESRLSRVLVSSLHQGQYERWAPNSIATWMDQAIQRDPFFCEDGSGRQSGQLGPEMSVKFHFHH